MSIVVYNSLFLWKTRKLVFFILMENQKAACAAGNSPNHLPTFHTNTNIFHVNDDIE